MVCFNYSVLECGCHKTVLGSQHLWVFGLFGDLWSVGSPAALPSHCGLVKSVYRQLNLSVEALRGFLVCKSSKDEPDSGVEQ